MNDNCLRKYKKLISYAAVFMLALSMFTGAAACSKGKVKNDATPSWDNIMTDVEGPRRTARHTLRWIQEAFGPKSEDSIYTLTNEQCIDICNRLTEWFDDPSKPLDTTNFDRVFYMEICGSDYVMVNVMPDCSINTVIIMTADEALCRPLYDENLIMRFDVEFCNKNYTYNYGGLTNLDFLTYFPNLLYLDIRYNKLEDISALTELKSLEYLAITGCQLNDISVLSGLTDNIMELKLQHNRISDISPLAGLKTLEVLELNYNKIEDISSLANLTGLFELKLQQNEISDISPLANLTNLTSLSLGNNKISDLKPLYTLKNLYIINLDERTDLCYNTISKKQIEELEEAMPDDCKIQSRIN